MYNDTIKVANRIISNKDLEEIFQHMDDKIREAKTVRVFSANGMVGKSEIIDMTAYGNRIKIKEVTNVDSNKVRIEICDTFYENRIDKVMLKKLDGTDDLVEHTNEGDKVAYVTIEPNMGYTKIAAVNRKGEVSDWYDFLQVESIESIDTGCRINVKKSVFPLDKVMWFYQNGESVTKEILGNGPISVELVGLNNKKESIMMIYVMDSWGTSVEDKAPSIKKAEKLESGKLNINIEKDTSDIGQKIDKVILYDRQDRVLKEYNKIDNLNLSYKLDDTIRASKKVKVVSESGLSREADIVQIEPKISSIELQKDKSIKVVIKNTAENEMSKLEWIDAIENKSNSVKINKDGSATIPKNSNVEKIRLSYDDKVLEYGLEIKRATKANVNGKGLWNWICGIFGYDKKGELTVSAKFTDTSFDTLDRIEIYVDKSWVKLESFDKNTTNINNKVFDINKKRIGATKVRIYTTKGFVAQSNIG